MKRDFIKWEVLTAAPLVKESEGLRLEAYVCPAGVPTIGYGHTAGVKLGTRITQADADRMLTLDLEKYKAQAAKYIHRQVTRGQFIAILDFAYNLGVRALASSTLLKLFNNGDTEGAAEQFSKWVYAAGKVAPGLVARRKKEKKYFLMQD